MSKRITINIDSVHRDQIDVSGWEDDPNEPKLVDGRWSFTVTVIGSDITYEEACDAFKDRTRFIAVPEDDR